MGEAIDLQVVRRSPPHSDQQIPDGGEDKDVVVAIEKLRDRRAHLNDVVSAQCETCTEARSCAGYQAIGEVLAVAAGAEEQLVTALERTVHGRTTIARFAEAAQQIAAIENLDELVAAIPELALLVCPGDASALLEVRADGSLKVLARSGAPFHAPQSRLAEEARAAVRARSPRTPHACPCDGAEPGCGCMARTAVIPLAHGAEGMVLALEWAKASASPGEAENEHLAVYASLAGAALARARAGAALQEATERDAATLGAIQDAVIAVDRDGTVRALNEAAAEALGVRCEDVLGRRLRQVPGLSALGLALTGAAGRGTDTVVLPRGEVTLRLQAYDGGVVATIREAATAATDHAAAHRMVGSPARFTFDHLVGTNPAFVRVMEDAKRAARSDIPVLVCGESGTGKEMLAQAIHNASPCACGPFLGINVTAIPRELLESELFGYEGGSFTGARTSGRGGKFELAGRGTLLLDEIGDMPLEMQSKLLRVLQEKVVQRIGSVRDIPVRARIIATTHRDLGEAVNQGRFRLDLFHRLRVLNLRIPPLRERKEDVPLLVEHQLRLHAERSRRRVRIAPEVLSALQDYDWPGNVRELFNVIDGELSILPAGQDVLTRIPPVLLQPRPPARPAAGAISEVLSLAEMERRACEESLARFKGNVARAAKALGVAKGTLYSKIKRYGIALPELFLSAPVNGTNGTAREH